MYYNTIPNTNLKISILGLGSMTFGEQNNKQEAYDQLNFSTNSGINFIDTSEIYPVPQRYETQGLSETYIGEWLTKYKKRNEIIISTKVSGPLRNRSIPIRKNHILNKKNIQEALNNSLLRLRTDYVDLYQIHWPQRTTNNFGKLNYQYTKEKLPVTILETLEALHECIKIGKVRYIGISNETPWGALNYIYLSKKYNLSRIITIQNPYNLLNRSFEIGLSEISQYENLKLIAYSPLAFGTLTGKYFQKNSSLKKSRIVLYPHFQRYNNINSQKSIIKYTKLAQKHSMNLSDMALSFIRQQPFIASILIGTTNLKQLQQNILSLDVKLNKEILSSIEEIHKEFTIPAP